MRGWVEAGSRQELVRSVRVVSPEHTELIWAKKGVNDAFCLKCLPDTLRTFRRYLITRKKLTLPENFERCYSVMMNYSI